MRTDDFLRRTVELTESRIEADLVALNVDQGSCHAFNAAAAQIFELTKRPIKTPELSQRLLAEVRPDAAACFAGLRILLAQWAREGLVIIGPTQR